MPIVTFAWPTGNSKSMKRQPHHSNTRRRECLYRITAEAPTTLIDLLLDIRPSLSRSRIKQLLSRRCVTVGKEPIVQFNTPISKGTIVEVYNIGFPMPFSHPLAKELWRDEYFILIEKRAGLPTIAKGGMQGDTLFRLLAAHEKADNSRAKIFLLNRLDSATCGLILFARDREIQQEVLSIWTRYIPEQVFEAVVEGIVEPEEGSIRWTKEQSERVSEAKYSVLSYGPWCTKLEIYLLGRYNALRTGLKGMGHAIVGDRHEKAVLAYSEGLALYQKGMTFVHPIDGKKYDFIVQEPKQFDKLLQRRLTQKQRTTIAIIEAEKEKLNQRLNSNEA